MTIKELIERLSELNQDATVYAICPLCNDDSDVRVLDVADSGDAVFLGWEEEVRE